MNRRDLLRGFAAAASGLLVPASVGEVAAEVERRWWALGAMPGRVDEAARINDALVREALWHEKMVREQAYLMQTERFDAGVPWDLVVTGVDVVAGRPPQVQLRYMKVPRTGTRFTIRAQWVGDA